MIWHKGEAASLVQTFDFLSCRNDFEARKSQKSKEFDRGLRGYARINTDGTKAPIRAYPRNPRSFYISVWVRSKVVGGFRDELELADNLRKYTPSRFVAPLWIRSSGTRMPRRRVASRPGRCCDRQENDRARRREFGSLPSIWCDLAAFSTPRGYNRLRLVSDHPCCLATGSKPGPSPPRIESLVASTIKRSTSRW
jgi:hypothetical protein